MARERARAEWEHDAEFCVIAAVAFWDDYACALAKGAKAAHTTTRKAASARMQHRYDGFVLGEVLERKVNALKGAVEALAEHMQKQAAATARAARG